MIIIFTIVIIMPFKIKTLVIILMTEYEKLKLKGLKIVFTMLFQMYYQRQIFPKIQNRKYKYLIIQLCHV